MSSSSSCYSSTSSTSSLDHLIPSEQLCYVHCNICDTILAVSVPCSSVFKTVTVRCGHCTNLLPVNMSMGGLLFPSMNLGHNFFAPHNLMEDSLNHPCSDMLMNQTCSTNDFMMAHVTAPRGGLDHHHHLDQLIPISPPVVNKPPEKRQRVPSAYNRFVKEEIQRIKAGNPDISHREAFGAAAKNWAHFPHIHFGLMPDDHSHTVKKTNLLQQQGENVIMKDGFFGSANVGVSPY